MLSSLGAVVTPELMNQPIQFHVFPSLPLPSPHTSLHSDIVSGTAVTDTGFLTGAVDSVEV